MSRIGKKLIEIPPVVKVEIDGQNIKVSGPKGQLTASIHQAIKAVVKDCKLFVMSKRELSSNDRGLWGLYQALIFNMVYGVKKGFEKKLKIEGVGFKAVAQGDELAMNLGFV